MKRSPLCPFPFVWGGTRSQRGGGGSAGRGRGSPTPASDTAGECPRPRTYLGPCPRYGPVRKKCGPNGGSALDKGVPWTREGTFGPRCAIKKFTKRGVTIYLVLGFSLFIFLFRCLIRGRYYGNGKFLLRGFITVYYGYYGTFLKDVIDSEPRPPKKSPQNSNI